MKKKDLFIIIYMAIIMIACKDNIRLHERGSSTLDTIVKPIIEKTKQTRWDPVIQQNKTYYYIGLEIDSAQIKRFPVARETWLSGKAVLIVKDEEVIKEIRLLNDEYND